MSFKKELMSKVLEGKIINIYLNDGTKIIIGKGGVKPSEVEYEENGFIIQSGPISKVWYNYNNIKQIDVFK